MCAVCFHLDPELGEKEEKDLCEQVSDFTSSLVHFYSASSDKSKKLIEVDVIAWSTAEKIRDNYRMNPSFESIEIKNLVP